jgi:hypothetical protein
VAGRGWEWPTEVASGTGRPAGAAAIGASAFEVAGFRIGGADFLITFFAAFLGAGFPAFFLGAAFLRDGIAFLQLVPVQFWVAAKL